MGKDSYALITGLFMSALIAGTVLIIIWLGNVQTETTTYIAETRESVTGLKVGSTVFYRGIAVGKVSAVHFSADDPDVILVPMEIESGVQLKQGVYAILELQGVTGLTNISLQDGGNQAEPLSDDDRLENRIPIKPSLIDRLSISGENTVNETRELLSRLNQLLDENNIHHVKNILINMESATERFNGLQDQAGKVLAQAPELTTDFQRTLAEVNGLSRDARQLSNQMRQDLATFSSQSSELVQAGALLARQLLHTTLPRANNLILQMQSTTRRFGRAAATIESDPQAFLFGAESLSPAPGESGFRELQ